MTYVNIKEFDETLRMFIEKGCRLDDTLYEKQSDITRPEKVPICIQKVSILDQIIKFFKGEH